jgi:Barstar (barnase inhibitor)
MTERRIGPASTKAAVIQAIYAAVQAPPWAAPNLDGLADVLRDLSWLPSGPVTLDWVPSDLLPAHDRRALHEVLRGAAVETAASERPVRIRGLQ